MRREPTCCPRGPVPGVAVGRNSGRGGLVLVVKARPDLARVRLRRATCSAPRLTMLSNLLKCNIRSHMETCYKLFRADLVKAMNLQSDRFGFEVEVTAYIAKTNARIFELPVSYYPRSRLAGKKIDWRDGLAALWHLVRFNLFTDEHTAFTDLAPRYQRS